MNTDEQILWLCEHGFTLPEGLTWESQVWRIRGRWVADVELLQQVHDLCAARFAREMGSKGIVHDFDFCHEWSVNTATGDSAAAIDALYRAAIESEG